MSTVVVDASVAAKWFVPEDFSDQAEELLADDAQLWAPDLLLAELGNMLWKKVRRGQITTQDAQEMVREIDQLPLRLTPTGLLLEAAVDLAVDLQHPVYDCLYLSLAMAQGSPLVTADRRLYNLAVRSGLAEHVRWVEDPV